MACGSVRPARRARRSSSSELRIAGVDGVMEASERGFVAWCLVALPPGSYSTPHQKSRELSRAGLMPKEIAGPARRQSRNCRRRRPSTAGAASARGPCFLAEQGSVSLRFASLRALARRCCFHRSRVRRGSLASRPVDRRGGSSFVIGELLAEGLMGVPRSSATRQPLRRQRQRLIHAERAAAKPSGFGGRVGAVAMRCGVPRVGPGCVGALLVAAAVAGGGGSGDGAAASTRADLHHGRAQSIAMAIGTPMRSTSAKRPAAPAKAAEVKLTVEVVVYRADQAGRGSSRPRTFRRRR